jgi:4-hydroxybenzoate polyprenyltransferase
MRFHKPVGIWLLLAPTMSALWLAGKGHPSLTLIGVFVVGTVIMRALGCVINDIADRDWDGAVPRTKNRPLVCGEISVRQAYILLFCLCVAASLCLFFLNRATIYIACAALALALIYPFVKRFSFYPQVVLGLAFSLSVPMACMAVLNTFPLWGWCLWLATMIWTVAYDTLYALADREADRIVGIKSTALAWGSYVKAVIVFLLLLTLLLWVVVGCLYPLGRGYWAALWVIFFGGLGRIIFLLFFGSQPLEQRGLEAFLWNQYMAFVYFAGIAFGVSV